MIPTLLVGDWLFVNKAIYGAHVPFSRASLPAYREPKRGDVVVFVSPYQGDEAAQGAIRRRRWSSGWSERRATRCTCGTRVLYVNGIAQRQGFGANAPPIPGMANSVDPLFDWQKKVGLKSSRFGAAPAQPTHDNWGPLVVPPQQSLHDGRQPLQLEGQPLLGIRPEGERPRASRCSCTTRTTLTTAIVRCRCSPTSGGAGSDTGSSSYPSRVAGVELGNSPFSL